MWSRPAPIAFALALVLAACATPQSGYEDARKRDTAEAYEKFLRKFPRSPYTAKANERLEQLRYDAAVEAGSAAAYELHLERYPKGPHVKQTTEALAKLRLAELRASGDADAYEEFLKRFADTSSAPPAERELDTLLWKAANGGDEAALVRYLERFPRGAHASAARRQVDPLLWRRVQATPDRAAYERYVRLLPDGAHRPEALDGFQALLWREASSDTIIDAYADYLRYFPRGPHAGEAQDCVDWAAAERKGTGDAVQAYLRDYPEGTHAERARAAMAVLATPAPPGVHEAAMGVARRLVKDSLSRSGGGSGMVRGYIMNNGAPLHGLITYEGTLSGGTANVNFRIGEGATMAHMGQTFVFRGGQWWPPIERHYRDAPKEKKK